MIAAIKDETEKSQAKEAERLKLLEFDGEVHEDAEEENGLDEDEHDVPGLEEGEEEQGETDAIADDVD